MEKEEKMCVITPTFNRAYILGKCYESLKQQTCKSFVWMIIDDGSTDNTEGLVNSWIMEDVLNIDYYKKENGGKASALNVAFEKTETEYLVCLDSDDTFSKNAIELALNELELIKRDSKYAGLLALRTADNGEVLGGKAIPEGVTATTLSEITDKFKIRSELICFYKTEIVKQYRFPNIVGEKFISPAFIEHEIGKNHLLFVSHDIFCYCSYLPDGLTKNKLYIIRKNPKGYTIVKRQSFELAEKFIPKSKHCLMYICGCILSGDKNCIKNSPRKIMTTLYYPLGWLAYKFRFK